MTQAAGDVGVRLDEVRGLEAAGRSGGRVAGQLEGERLARQRGAVRRRPTSIGVGDAVLGVGEQRGGLLVAVGRRVGSAAIGLPAAVADGGLLEHVAVGVDLQRQRVLDARVGRVALVVVGDRLARVGEEDGVAVGAPRLQAADGEVLLGDGVRRAGALDLLGRAGSRRRRRPPGAASSP